MTWGKSTHDTWLVESRNQHRHTSGERFTGEPFKAFELELTVRHVRRNIYLSSIQQAAENVNLELRWKLDLRLTFLGHRGKRKTEKPKASFKCHHLKVGRLE